MPTFDSRGNKEKGIPPGRWVPAHERAFDPQTGEMYDGPDRAAVEFLQQNGGDLGQDALKDPQLMQASRNAGFNSVQEYLDYYAPKPEELKAIEESMKKPVVTTHANPKPKRGVDTPTRGGFYDADKETPDSAMSKKG